MEKQLNCRHCGEPLPIEWCNTVPKKLQPRVKFEDDRRVPLCHVRKLRCRICNGVNVIRFNEDEEPEVKQSEE